MFTFHTHISPEDINISADYKDRAFEFNTILNQLEWSIVKNIDLVLCYLVHKPLKKDQYFSSTDLTLVQYHIYVSLEDNAKNTVYVPCMIGLK